MTRDLLIAVDGGGTKTQALVTDLEGNVLARGLGPGSNHHSVGLERFGQAVTTAVEGALINVLGPGSGPGSIRRCGRIAAACFGLAGVDSPDDERVISGWLREQEVAPRFMVVNDSELILAAGTPEGWGVALISGTGSVCLGRSPAGTTIRVGGWGPLMGDEGSGYYIAIRALRAATQSADGRIEAPALLKAVLRHWSLAEPQGLIAKVHAGDTTPAEIAGLAVTVLDLAAKGDPAAHAILEDGARELALQVRTVIRKLALNRPPLALAGGMLRASLRKAVLASLGEDVGPVGYIAEPALGAVVLARRLLSQPRS
jgi:N-acetylglucosamine kinase-like BadF-type ATPase